MTRLHRSDPSEPGIVRRRIGRGFGYYLPDGRKVTDTKTLERIRELAIPPAWLDVQICLRPTGHIQATGTDARGRRQYVYHKTWRAQRDREKFDHMIDFAHRLPHIRAVCATRLHERGLTRERVLSCLVRLLDVGFFRIGTEGYAEQNQTFGLATMRRRHVLLEGKAVRFDYIAKSGKRRIQSVVDPEVIKVVRSLKARIQNGNNLFAFKRGREWVDVRSNDINDYLKEISDADITAKDFRTWNATVIAAVALGVATEVTSPAQRTRAVTRAVKEVAHYLGNTPAVTRASYIDPRIIDAYLAGDSLEPHLDLLGEHTRYGGLAFQGGVERAVLELLDPSAVANAS